MKNINIKGIHPAKFVKKESEIFKKELAGYLDKKGNFKHGKDDNCVVCRNNRLKVMFFKNGFKIIRCEKCNLVFANPRPTAKFLKMFYTQGPTYKYMQNVILQKTAKFRNRVIIKPKLDTINKLSRGKLLDIGCASGAFLGLAKKHGWDCYGVEPSEEALKHFTDQDIRVFKSTIEELKSDKKFDVITCWELIEHILDPLKLFRKARALLNPRGVLVFSTPNSDGFDMTVLREKADAYAPPSHLNYFNPKAIKFALNKAGFKKIKIETPGIFDLDKVVNALKLTKPTFDFRKKFIRFLQENKWSGHMVVIGFK